MLAGCREPWNCHYLRDKWKGERSAGSLLAESHERRREAKSGSPTAELAALGWRLHAADSLFQSGTSCCRLALPNRGLSPARPRVHSFGRADESPPSPNPQLADRIFVPPPLLPTIIEALNDRDWTYTVNEELDLVTFGVAGEHTAYNCALFADDETRLVTMIAQSPMRVPHEERLSACELLMRANHGLMFGAFDIDFSDGEVRFKVAVDVEGGTLGVGAVHSMITVALDMYELWYPPLMKVVYGGVTPEDAVAEVNARLGGDGEDGEEGEDIGFDVAEFDVDADDADDDDDDPAGDDPSRGN